MSNVDAVQEHFRSEGAIFGAMGSPFTGGLLLEAADALGQPGVTRELVGDWPGNPRADALSARFCGALRAAVLSGRDPELAACYPTPDAPGDVRGAWVAAERFMTRDPAWVADWITSPPQTNEVRRTSGLLPGLFVVAEEFGLPLDLFELGASAGLNMQLDRFAYRNAVWHWGDGDVLIDTEWSGPAPPVASLDIGWRRACDQRPVRVADADERLRLRSFVWADQFDRMARLDAAIDLTLAHGATVDEADAADWLEARLGELRDGRTSVVYHSIFWHYPPTATRARIESMMAAAGERATASRPLAWLRFEFEAALRGPRDSTRCLLELITWPGGERRVLAEVDSHGRFVRWGDPDAERHVGAGGAQMT